MPKNRPTIGQQNWGQVLNDHLNQLSPNGGGINFGTTAQRPSLGANDDGYTFVDITTKELLRWNGSGWVVLLKANTSNIGDPIPFDITAGKSIEINANATFLSGGASAFGNFGVPFGYTFIVTSFKLLMNNVIRTPSVEVILPQPNSQFITQYMLVGNKRWYETFTEPAFAQTLPETPTSFGFTPINDFQLKITTTTSKTVLPTDYSLRVRDTILFFQPGTAIASSVVFNASNDIGKVAFVGADGILVKNRPDIDAFSMVLSPTQPLYSVPNGKILNLVNVIIHRQADDAYINTFPKDSNGNPNFTSVSGTGDFYAVGVTSAQVTASQGPVVLATASNSYVNQFATDNTQVRQFNSGTNISLSNANPSTYAIISGYLTNA